MLAIAEQQIHERPGSAAFAYAGYQIIRRNGAVVAFEPHKIAVALMKAFLAIRSNTASRAKSPCSWLLASGSRNRDSAQNKCLNFFESQRFPP